MASFVTGEKTRDVGRNSKRDLYRKQNAHPHRGALLGFFERGAGGLILKNETKLFGLTKKVYRDCAPK